MEGKEKYLEERLKTVNGLVNWHLSQLVQGSPNASQYIPYSSVFNEFKRQQKIALLRLNTLKLALESSNGTDENKL